MKNSRIKKELLSSVIIMAAFLSISNFGDIPLEKFNFAVEVLLVIVAMAVLMLFEGRISTSILSTILIIKVAYDVYVSIKLFDYFNPTTLISLLLFYLAFLCLILFDKYKNRASLLRFS
ncbi:hypothetical protein L0B53_11910 [Vibrio sp. SS-MA-C1-2]|uniref:hypothetical protein n=1 Tax=Vibrio sp. SS-MA-C1-2 TaxID=2908646 RepID=UPI001F205E3C|nr:hypothetical protein [Vibrio sp. SS-MA-C1-2]UJF17735.1 hypothetical protein L0B53_11910 [Vibrio sp. SS-MA-C1-2]